MTGIARLPIRLDDVRELMRHHTEMPRGIPLDDLRPVVQAAMGWGNDRPSTWLHRSMRDLSDILGQPFR